MLVERIVKFIVRFGDWCVRTLAETSLFFCGYWTGCFVISDRKIYLLLVITNALIAYNEYKGRKHNAI